MYEVGDYVIVKSRSLMAEIVEDNDDDPLALKWIDEMFEYCGHTFKIDEVWHTNGLKRFSLKATDRFLSVDSYTFCAEWVVVVPLKPKEDIEILYLKDILSNYDCVKSNQMAVMDKIQTLQSELNNINLELDGIRSKSYKILS